MKKLLALGVFALLLVACAGQAAPMGGPVGAPEPGRMSDGNTETKTGAGGAGGDRTTIGTPGNATVPVPQAFNGDRAMILTASIAMRSRDAWAAADRAQAVALGLGGDVIGLSQAGTGDQRSASVVLRVPSARFNDALRQLRELADVEIVSSAVEGKDVTDQFVDLEARLKAKQAEEQRYVALLARANTIEEILRIDQALSSVRTQIEQLTGQLNSIRNRTQFSTITVQVTPLAVVPVTQPGAYDPSKTVERALATLVALARVGIDLLIWVLVFGWIPLLVVGGVLAAQRMRTRPASA